MKKQTDITPDFLFHIAQGFYDIGYLIAIKLKNDSSTTGFQRIAPAVVNLSFSIELLLKGLNSITKKSDLTGHKFYDLYKQLPGPIKLKIETKYRDHISNSEKELTKIRIILSKVEVPEKPHSPDSKINDDMSIEDLLILHNDSFINWRYLYEVNVAGYEYEYDFKLMVSFAKSLIEVINEIKATQPPTFILNKVK
jgi:hypothetical protein